MLLVGCHDAEAAAALNVQVSEIESQNVEFAAIDNHQLAVIADQVVRGSCHCHAGAQQTKFELAQTPLASAIGISNQGVHMNAARNRAGQSFFDLAPVEAKDHNLHAFS